MNLFLEIFGYLGTALVIVSMMMTSVKWLRLLNLSGAVICAIYGLLSGTYPTMVLNVCLVLIQMVQLLRLRRSNS